MIQINPKNSELKNIIILATGGTIAGTGEDGKTTNYTAGNIDIEVLVSSVRNLDKIANIYGEQIANVDSNDITMNHWLILANRINELSKQDDVDGFVITHGTDTLEETAYFLDLTVKTDKPVVLTGAMRPSTATSADGPLNLYQSVALAASDLSRGHGAMVVFSDGIYSGRNVQKINTFKTNAFNSIEFGCLGYMRDNIPFFFNKSIKPHTIYSQFDVTGLTELPKVSIAYFHIDADPSVIDYFAQNSEGIVIAGAGSGTFSSNWLEEIRNLETKGIPVVRSSRIGNGIILTDSTIDKYSNCIPSYTLSPPKSRILLTLALTKTKDYSEIKRIFAEY
ncbi:asparaginase [Clostridium beijerinckii]|uniref:asparaginase n=1 Tax=Clostridium beijerinckii TaxID=1520 RepID=UPI00080A57B4|nr:asparaginase [Clostridium beijerinckii]OCA98960.1 L-asparaginase [Clostridium beijerinckii]